MTIFSITYRFISKELFDRSLVKQGSAQNSQHFVCCPLQFKVMLYNSYHAISCDSGKYLDSYSTFSCPPEGLNLKMLLNPFKKEFHSPTIFIQEGNLQSRYFQVVGQVDKSSVQISCIVDNSAKFFRILLGSVVTCQFYKLIREYAIFIMVDIKFFKDFILEIPSLPYNKNDSISVI